VQPVDSPSSSYARELCHLGREAGLHRVGIAPADPLLRARDALVDRAQRGLADTMQFTYRNPVRSTTPTTSVEGARSIIVGARSYYADLPSVIDPDAVNARVARYAWVDHYKPLRDALRVVVKRLRKDGHKAVLFADDNSLVDREVAWLAGLGWFGKNANLLLEGVGSWFVLGSVVTTAVLPVDTPVPDGCGACHRCLDACPTGAIVEPGVIDARKCLAWVMQKPGLVPVEMREAIGDRIYGCDDCQDVCPPTMRLALKQEIATGAQPVVDVVALLAMSDAEVVDAYGRWYMHNREVRWVRRNALIVLGNIGRVGSHVETIERYLADPDPHLRAHAVWAAGRLGLHRLLPASDDDPTVNHELAMVPATRGQH
jgi:epoxyqueuosine reductase